MFMLNVQVFCILSLFILILPNGYADELSERAVFWNQNALLCEAGPDGIEFPSKQTGESQQPCDDGDMTLFNGLLCASGEERGCVGVREAQDPATGQWFRSPRIRLGGNDRGGASFSPDMALGVQLYLLKTRDITRGWKWLMWINENVPCVQKIGDICLLQGLPRVCTDAPGCTLGHGATAVLAATVDYLQMHFGLSPLPNGRLRAHLGSFSGYGPDIEDLDSITNKDGYSQHLVAVSVMTLRMAGVKDAKLDAAVSRLSQKNPNNAFFTYMNEGATTKVKLQTLARCPSPSTVLKQPLFQWQWERDDSDRAWEHSSYWDCIFIFKLLN